MDHIDADEVLFEILKRLPVKSLLRFSSVSRTWSHLITNPIFVNSHLQFNKQSPSSVVVGLNYMYQHRCRGTKHDGKFHYFRIDNTKKTISEHLMIKFPWKVDDDKETVTILGHCNGVVLALYSQDTYIITNPITRSFHILPESGIELPDLTFVGHDPRDKDWCYKKLIATGFGFVDLVYKVVRVTYGMGRFVPDDPYWNECRAYERIWVEVYDSRSLSWRRVLVDSDLSYEHMHGGVYNAQYYNYHEYDHGGVYNSFDGCVYWLGKTTTHSAIVWFDLVKEKMHQTLVPYKPRHEEDGVFGEFGTTLGVQVSGRCVVVLVGDQRNKLVFSVWKMNKLEEDHGLNHINIKVSWTHMYRLVFGGWPKGFSRNGELLLRIDREWGKLFLHDSNNMNDAEFTELDLGVKVGNIVPDFVQSLVVL